MTTGVGDALKIKHNQALGYHIDVPVRLRSTMEAAIEQASCSSSSSSDVGDGAASSHSPIRTIDYLPVQPTKAALRYKTNEILALEQEVGASVGVPGKGYCVLGIVIV